MVKLYNYYRSSSSYRVRIALHLKKIPFEYIPIHLVKDGGQQHQTDYLAINPMAEVPSLEHDGHVISQSVAIIEYLDRVWPTPPLYGADPLRAARVRQICEIVNSGIQPLQNLKVLNFIIEKFNQSPVARTEWAAYWIQKGFYQLEAVLAKTQGHFAVGDHLSAADLFIIPQVYNAKRFNIDLARFPRIQIIDKTCGLLEAFKLAAPENQPDWEAD